MTTSRAVRFVMVMWTIMATAGIYATIQWNKAEAGRDSYKSKYLEVKNNYEGTVDQLNGLEKTNADLTQRLYEAYKRERAAKVRASRSRVHGSTESRSAGSRDANTSDSTKRANSSYLGVRDITMYCPTGNRTASGKWPTVGMVATLSRSIPFGTHIRIDGLGEYVVEDRIGHGSEFDIFTPSCSEADRFGREHRVVTILR